MSKIMLESLSIHNFKSFYKSEFKFGKLNCLIAPNNSGKSNLIDALKFLNDLIYHNPAKAIAKIGFKNIKNFHYDENEINLNAKFKIENRVLVGDELIDYDITLLFLYKLDFKLKKPNIDIWIDGKVKSIIVDKADLKEGFGLRVLGSYEEYINNYDFYVKKIEKKNYRSFHFDYNHIALMYNISETRLDTTKEIVKKLLGLDISKVDDELQTPLDFRFIFNKSSLFASHYFHAHDIKRPEISGLNDLLENGKNLVEYLDGLDKDVLEDISTSLIGEVELINSIEIKEDMVSKLVFKEEVNGKITDVDIGVVSDGTVHFIAIMSALIGNKHSIGMMIEEPERHMHMKVLSTILNTMRDDDKQIFFTTHSTEILQQLELEEILFMFRDYNGDTQGQRAKDIPNIKKIMKLFKGDLVEMIHTGVLGEYDE